MPLLSVRMQSSTMMRLLVHSSRTILIFRISRGASIGMFSLPLTSQMLCLHIEVRRRNLRVRLSVETGTVSIQCRRDNGSVCVPPIYASFGPQNITVITSQESHYWNAFLIGFSKIHFPHPPNYGYWDVLYTVGKV